VPEVVMNPRVDDIQAAINTIAKRVLQSSKLLSCWGMPGGPATYYDMIARDKEIVKIILLLTGSLVAIRTKVADYMQTFMRYQFLWKTSLASVYAEFMKTSPGLDAFEGELKKYMALEQEILGISAVHNIGSLSLESTPLKQALRSEAANWKAQFAKNIHKQAAEDLKVFDGYVRDTTMKLSRSVDDLEDVRTIMFVLREVREKEAQIDFIITPIEEMYALLNRYEVRVPKEELATVSDLRYSWKKLRKLAMDVSDTLTRMQVGFKRTLIREVKAFVIDAQNFRRDWEAHGPMVPGLDPMEAVDRLKKFQQMFEVRKRKWESYVIGEELFGLAVTQYPELEETEKEISMLDRLYSLYVAVIGTIKGYGDYLWVDVVEKIDEMSDQVNTYANQSKKLPRALRDWPAYNDCRIMIESFLEELPLYQALAHKSMRDRHWKEVMRISARELNLAEDAFKLQHLLDCKLLTRQRTAPAAPSRRRSS